MGGKDCFQVGIKHLRNANYYLPLDEDCYIASYQERVLVGHVEDFDDDNAKFNKKAIVIPSNVYFQFVDTISKAHDSFERNDQESFEVCIYKHKPFHHIVGKYEKADDDSNSEFLLKLIIKWNFKNDRSYQKLVEQGMKDPINITDPLADKEWLFLRRGVFLSKDQVEMIHMNLSTILQYSYYNQDSKKIVLEFIDYVLSKPKLKTFVQDQIKDYEGMTYQAKMKLIKDILIEMSHEKRDQDAVKTQSTSLQHQEKEGGDQSYTTKMFLDALANKVQLVFSLLNYHLKQ